MKKTEALSEKFYDLITQAYSCKEKIRHNKGRLDIIPKREKALQKQISSAQKEILKMPALAKRLKEEIEAYEEKIKKIQEHKGIQALSEWDKRQIKKVTGIQPDDCWNTPNF